MDYAVVGWREEEVQFNIRFIESHQHEVFHNFGRFMGAAHGDQYYFARRGAIVFSDVDGTDEHQKAMRNREYSMKRPLLTKHQKTLGLGLERALAHEDSDAQSNNCDCQKVDGNHSDGIDDHETDDEGSVALENYELNPTNCLNYYAFSYIITLPTKDDKTALMEMVSGEVAQKAPRPTMVLVDLVSTHQSLAVGEGSGYAIAYDIVEDRIVVKPFKTYPTHHPLGEPWFTAPEADMASFVGSPGVLARRIAHREGLDDTDPNYGFVVVTRVIAGYWILSLLDALRTVPGPGHGDLLDEATVSQLDAVLEEHETELDNIPFPNKLRADDPESTNFAYNYHVMSQILEDMEGGLRRCALDGKKKGQDKAADNLAKFYDGVLKAAVALAKDPEMEVHLWEV
ncbi:MAG: hypothetical protein M1812_001705 [Candelaria pacifica]|nr:MAG: hypothetical protein M1812_001705 [Candelaria pacifica]